MLVRARCIRELGGFDEALIRSQDYDFIVRLAVRYAGAYVDEVIFHQRIHEAPRGSARQPIRWAEVEAAWKLYDALIFRRFHQTLPLEAYLRTPARPPLDPKQTRLALVQRGCVMARKGLWDIASADFAHAAILYNAADVRDLEADARRALRRIFEMGSRSRAESGDVSDRLAFLSTIQDRSLRSDIEAALLWPTIYTFRKAAVDRRWADLSEAVGVVSQAANARSVSRLLRQKLRPAGTASGETA